MKKRILSLILIMPFLVMLLAFGFSRTINLFVEPSVDDISWDYEENEALVYTAEQWEKGVKLKAVVHPATASLSNKIKWTVGEQTNLSGDPDEICYIDGDTLYRTKEGFAEISASVEGSSITKTFSACLIYLGDELTPANDPRAILMTGTDYSVSSIKRRDIKTFGLYNLENGEKKKAAEHFTAKVYPSGDEDLKLDFAYDSDLIEVRSEKIGDGAFDVEIELKGAQEKGADAIALTTSVSEKVTNVMWFNIVDGINVRCYDDLMYCTRDEEHSEVVVLRTSLESEAVAALNPKYGLFGRKSADGVECDYKYIESTYDTKYYQNRYKADYKNYIKLAVGVTFYKDVYGNGYTLNAHELCYPSGEQERNGVKTAMPLQSDIYKGPLLFVYASTAACYGQDNIGFLIGDGVTVDNVTLKNCNNVDNLSNLDYVGTVVEVTGDNVTLKNCQIMNGRTVVRAMSVDNLTIDACMLSYAREFILKVGSNKFEYAEGISDKTYEALSPSELADGTKIADHIDCTVTVRNSYFHTSGVFSVGMDTHFAGEFLYDFNENVYGMAATSYPSELHLEGDVMFYDWKTVEGLDSTTLISIDSGSKWEDLFNISNIINEYNDAHPDTDLIYHDASDGDKAYVHGGVAFFGGGRNLSRVYFDDMNAEQKDYFIDKTDKCFEVSLKNTGLSGINDVLWRAAGTGPFKFYLYDAANPSAYSLVGRIPTVTELRYHAVN